MRRHSMRLARVSPSILAVAALLLVPISPVSAASMLVEEGGEVRHTITMNAGMPAVTDIMLLKDFGPGSSGARWKFWAAGDGASTTIIDPYYNDEPEVATLLLGLVQGLPSDGDTPVLHLVMMMSDAAAAIADGAAWGTLFGDVDEELLIEALHDPSANNGDGYETLRRFAFGEATTIPVDGGTLSAWFAPGDAFKVVAFSDGQIIGSGVSEVVSFGPGPGPGVVPEPTSLALAGLGVLGVLAHDLNRRRRAA